MNANRRHLNDLEANSSPNLGIPRAPDKQSETCEFSINSCEEVLVSTPSKEQAGRKLTMRNQMTATNAMMADRMY